MPLRVACGGQVELERRHVPGLEQGRMDFDRIVGLQADLDLEHVAGVDDAKPVRRRRGRARRNAARAAGRRSCRRGGTRSAASRVLVEGGHRAVEEGRIIRRTSSRGPDGAGRSGRPGRRRNRPGPGWSSSRSRRSRASVPARSPSLRIASNRRFEPEPVVQDLIDRVERRAAADVDRLVARHAQLHANALK